MNVDFADAKFLTANALDFRFFSGLWLGRSVLLGKGSPRQDESGGEEKFRMTGGGKGKASKLSPLNVKQIA
jgi:hypothetical protein